MTTRISFAVALAAGMTTLIAQAGDVRAEGSHRDIVARGHVVDYEPNISAETAATDEVETASVSGADEHDSPFAAIIERHAAGNGVPLSLALAVVRVESNYRADARGSAGEVGLMQIKPGTARMMGYSGSIKGLYDPETNIRYGMKYLGMAHELGDGTTCGTILKYNAGHAARRMNSVSAGYCSKVKRFIGS